MTHMTPLEHRLALGDLDRAVARSRHPCPPTALPVARFVALGLSLVLMIALL